MDGNLQTVQDIFNNNEYDDIQAALSCEWTVHSDIVTILDLAIAHLSDEAKAQGEIGKNVEIVKQIWQKADQKTRDSVCGRAIDSFGSYPEGINSSNIGIYPDLKEVIQEMEEHKRVKGLNCNLREAIKSFDVDQVKAALKNCGEDVKSVLVREVYWSNGGTDALLVFPLKVKYKRGLSKEEFEKIKEITKLLWDKASPDVRDFWLKRCITNEEGQGTGDNYIIDFLEIRQKWYAGIVGEGWLEDFIQEVKDYRRQRDIELNDLILEEEDKQAFELAKQESLLTASIWSEHKGKIALSVVGLCAAGAIAAYVLAYPAVALALAVLAAAILMGAGIAKVLEDPSVERPLPPEQGVQH